VAVSQVLTQAHIYMKVIAIQILGFVSTTAPADGRVAILLPRLRYVFDENFVRVLVKSLMTVFA